MIDDSAAGRPQGEGSASITGGLLGLAINRSAGSGVSNRMMAGIQAGFVLLMLVGCAAPDWRGHGPQERDRQHIVAAHPEWPPEILAAMSSGVICAGMSPDMVRAAWGQPSRTSFDGGGSGPYDTWYYAGRQHNMDMIGSQTGRARPAVEWTVSFANGWVVGWTD